MNEGSPTTYPFLPFTVHESMKTLSSFTVELRNRNKERREEVLKGKTNDEL